MCLRRSRPTHASPRTLSKQEDWDAQPPFPVVHTLDEDFLLVSQSNTPNYVLHVTLEETIDANGVPTVIVSNISMDCRG
jgi:hypothetical protein